MLLNFSQRHGLGAAGAQVVLSLLVVSAWCLCCRASRAPRPRPVAVNRARPDCVFIDPAGPWSGQRSVRWVRLCWACTLALQLAAALLIRGRAAKANLMRRGGTQADDGDRPRVTPAPCRIMVTMPGAFRANLAFPATCILFLPGTCPAGCPILPPRVFAGRRLALGPPHFPSPSSDVEVTSCALVDANICRGMPRRREWAITY